jgi:high-affinity iron transporter
MHVESFFAWGFGGLLTGLREGVEAALIVGIIASYLVKIGRGDRLSSVWLGVAAAVAASATIGVLAFLLLGSLQGTAEKIFAGSASLLAVVILTYMLFWMRKQAITLGAELRSGVDRAVASTSVLGLSLLAFTAVIREGIETALFLLGQTTAAADQGLSVVVGAFIGLLIAAGIGVLIFRAGLRLNLSAFFNVTGAALVVIASGLLSYGVHEFIELGLLPALINPVYDISAILPHKEGIGQFLRAIVGYSSTPELTTLLAQGAYLIFGLFFYVRPVRRAAADRAAAGA